MRILGFPFLLLLIAREVPEIQIWQRETMRWWFVGMFRWKTRAILIRLGLQLYSNHLLEPECLCQWFFMFSICCSPVEKMHFSDRSSIVDILIVSWRVGGLNWSMLTDVNDRLSIVDILIVCACARARA